MSRELLRVDFEAALAKLGPAQLQGRWQLATELVRLAIAAGARTVELDLGGSRLALEAPGARVEGLPDLAAVLDTSRPADERHHALMRLEERDALALQALAAFERRRLEIDAGEGGGRLVLRPGERPRLEPGGRESFAVKLSSRGLEAARAAAEVAKSCRFAPVPIVLDGRRIRRGFKGSLIYAQVRRPLPAALSIAATGEVPRLWLLRHGVVSTRATVPGYPPFEAAVEMSAIASPSATGAALREAIQPHLEALIRTALSLAVQLAHQAPALSEEVRQRAARVLLMASRHDGLAPIVDQARVFPLEDADAGRRFLALGDLGELVHVDATGQRLLHALFPGDDPTAFVLSDRPPLVLSAAERTLVGEHLGVRFRPPPRRPRRRRSPRRLAAEAFSDLLFSWYDARGRLLADTELEAPEHAFLRALAGAPAGSSPSSAVFFDGTGKARVTSDGRLLLPRRAPEVRSAVAAVARDPAWLYPALLGLCGGHEMPSEGLREVWIRRQA